MEKLIIRVFLGAAATVVAVAVLVATALNGCAPMSIRVRNSAAGFNGSFELEERGLPVNWYIHAPPLRRGDAEVSLDPRVAADGTRSLKFVVHRVDAARGWRAPGLFQVVPASAGASYTVSFWLRSQGCATSLLLTSEKPKTGPVPQRTTLGEAEIGLDTWRRFEFDYRVPPTYENIRFELDVVQPGTLWVDGVRIEKAPAE